MTVKNAIPKESFLKSIHYQGGCGIPAHLMFSKMAGYNLVKADVARSESQSIMKIKAEIRKIPPLSH